MRWFKHMADACKDDKIISLRATFGMWGVGVYWTLLEMVAEQIKENSERACVSLIVSELLSFFGVKRNKLQTFLEYSQNIRLIEYELKGNVLEINIPKLLFFADNYLKYHGRSLKCLQRQKKLSSKQDKNRIDKTRIEESTKSVGDVLTLPELNEELTKAVTDFIKFREEIKKPLSQMSLDAILKKLSTYPSDTAVRMLQQSIEHGWKSVYELKENFRSNLKINSRANFRHGLEEINHLKLLAEKL